MKMSEIIVAQSRDIAVMCAAGMTVMIFHDLLGLYQRKRKPAAAVAFVQDLLFWVFAALLASSFLYYCAYGSVTFHSLGAFCIGAALWETCFVKKFSQSNGPFCAIIKHKALFRKGVTEGRRHGEKKKKPRI